MNNIVFSQHTEVLVKEGSLLSFPWTGGFDACQFGEIQLDEDGILDLIVFDRRGNRLLCFINDGIPEMVSYQFAPEYQKLFPALYEWAAFVDYDRDGKTDIFTYSPGWAGMKVFRNVGQSTPAFDLVVSPYLTSLQGGGYVNIIATNADYPAIVDIDNDGDLDILTFWALGTYIETHLNQSIEKYGHADSLDYKKTDFCWGRVAEDEENNMLYLDTCLFEQTTKDGGFRHRGATMLVNDFTGNGLHDMLLADVDYPGLTLLSNGGTISNALITSQDTAFPSNNEAVHLFSMPLAAFIDVNNDGKRDLLVSPFDPNPNVTENKGSIWLYLNEGDETLPEFHLIKKDFLQNQTIDLGSGSYPIVVDITNDGKKDLVVGNFGNYIRSWYTSNTLHSEYISQLVVFENTGTSTQAAFKLINNDLANLSDLNMRGLTPAFADLTGDGLPDLLVGNESGQLIFVEQTTFGQWTIRNLKFQDIDIGDWSSPQLFDLDEDGIVDLLVGSRNGKIAFYKGENIDENIHFELITDFVGNVNVTDFSVSYDGFSTPHFFISPDNNMYLLCGSEQGKLFLFDQIRENLNGSFREINDWAALIDTNVNQIDVGMRSAGCIAQINETGKLQLFAGNYSGGLQLFNGTVQVAPGMVEQKVFDFEVIPNPAMNIIRIKVKNEMKNFSKVQILSLNGQLILSSQIEARTNSIDLNISQLKAGIYFVLVENESIISAQKFVKM